MVRVKRRYILFEILLDKKSDHRKFVETFSDKSLYKGLRAILEKIHGDFALGCLIHSLSVKRFNKNTMTAIIRVQREGAELMFTSLPFLRQLQGFDCILRTIHVSGTMRGCLKGLQAFHLKKITPKDVGNEKLSKEKKISLNSQKVNTIENESNAQLAFI